MTLWKNYHLARNLHDALETLAAAQRDHRLASLVAGGSDLLLDMQQGRHAPVDTLVDVTAVPEMVALEIRQERLYIGASVPLNRIVDDPLVCQHAQAVQEACGLIGGPQVRNTATLGGNVGTPYRQPMARSPCWPWTPWRKSPAWMAIASSRSSSFSWGQASRLCFPIRKSCSVSLCRCARLDRLRYTGG
jgi:CO/xanthine dehydrogenase FAD-binding subunit